MHTVHGATRLALVPEDQVPIPPCCRDTADAFVSDDDDSNSLLENMMHHDTYPCDGTSFALPSFDRSVVDPDRGQPREVSPMHRRRLRSGASLLDQNTHMTTVVEEGEDEPEDACKPPPAKVPRSESSHYKNDASATSARLGQTLSTVMEPIRSGIMSLADDFPSLSLFATRTDQGKDLGTEIVMGRPGDGSHFVSPPWAAAIKPSLVRRQVTQCDDAALYLT